MAKQWWEEAPLAQEQRGEWWEAAPLAQAPAQPKQDEWWKAAPKLDAEEKPQATTSNPFMGILGRAASLAGAGVGAVAEVAERIGDKLELAVPLSGISEEDVKNKKQLQPLFDWAKSLKDFDESIGYQPSTQLKELASNPLKAVPFIAERVLTSSPDMVAAVGVLPAYIMSRTKEILDERVKNDEKTLDEATVGDVTAAVTAAVVEGTLERFASKGLLKSTPGKTGAGRIGKETATQAGTEVVEEEAAYLGEAAGTKKGLSAEEALNRGLEAAIVGGGLGAGVQGTKEYLNRKPETPPETVAGQPTTTPAVEEAAAAPATPGVVQIDPARVEQLTLDLIDGGLTPAEAKIAAVEAATREAEDYADNERAAQGAENVAGVDTTAGGAGAPVVGQPGAVSAPAGVGAIEPSGVVPAGQDVAATPTGEAVQQPALIPPSKTSVLDTSKYVYHAVRSDADLASIMKSGVAPGTNVSTSHNGQAFAGEGDTILVLPKQGANITTKGYQNDSVVGERVFPVAVLKDLSLAPTQPKQAALDALGEEYEKISAQLAAFDKTLGITEEQRVQLAVRNSEETKKVFGDFYDRIMQLNREENRIFREMDRAESLPQEVLSPTDILQQYSKYGVPAFALNAQYDESTDNTELQVSETKTVEGIPPVEEQAALQEELAAEQAKTDVDYAEEAPIPDSVANVVGDLADLAPEIEAETQAETEAAPKGKRGPKGARLTPEQKAASDQRREQQRKDWKSNKKAVDAADTALTGALTPLDPSGYDSLEAAQEAVESQRIGKIQAIKSLMLLGRALKGTELGARVETLLKNPAITAKELADIKAGIAAQVSKSAAQVKTGRADTRFSGMTTSQQALRHVIKTGNPFQKFLAQRLLPFVKDVRFQVIEEDAPLPKEIIEGGATKDWDMSRGMFLRIVATGERFVYVRGLTGGPSQGINNVTVLHEMLHAALNKKMDMADWALREDVNSNSALVKAFKSLKDTIRLTQERMADMEDAGTLSESMYQLVDSGIFTDAREFVAYAMTDPAFQRFLMDTPGAMKQSLFTRFVNNVRQFFNMGPMHTSALSDVISITDKMISTRMTRLMRNEVKNEQAEATQLSSQLKAKKKKVNATEVKIEKSDAADTFRDLGTLTKLRSVDDFLNVMMLRSKSLKNAALRQLLPMLQTSAVVQWADRSGIKGIKESWQYLGDMAAMRNERTNALRPISDRLAKLHRKNIQQFKALKNVMNYSTLLSRDPTKPFYLLAGTGKDRISMSFATVAERDAYVQANTQKLQDLGGGREFTDSTLERLWKGLTPDVKKLYSEVRDFYIENHDAYQNLLQEQINASKLDPTAQKKVIAELKKMYEDGKKLYPYFPLMRYGQFWLRVGKGKNREFYMFESEYDRDAFAQARAKQLGESFEDLMGRKEMDAGNDLSDARKRDLEPSGMLKKMFEAIDSGAIGQMVDDGFGNLVPTGMSKIDVERLKDEIYQMYLQTLPDRNFRRQFMHRQGTTGFTGDIARNFAVTGTNMANQLARIKYGPKIMAQIDRANDSLEGNPDKVKLGEFVTEMRMRAEEQVRPNPEDGIAFAASNLLNQSAYLWLMTSVKTAVAQLTAIPIFVGPVLTSNHGFNPAKVAISLTKSLAIFGSTGIKRTAADGTSTYEFPSMLNNQLVKLTGDEKLAAQYMVDRGLSDTTLAYDLGNRRSEPTQATEGTTRRVLRATSNTMTALFHHTERMVREVTFMTSYRLYRDEINPATKKKYTHEEALPLAETEAYQALGNYHASERPRGLLATAERGVLINAHKPLGRSLLQFKMFPAFVTTFFVRNAYRMFAGLDAKDRAKAMAQLFGTLAMSGMLAGYAGVPGASMLMGVLQGINNALRDEDEDDPLDGRDLEFWFRNKWLPETFGSVKVGNHTLDEILDRGVLTAMTGYDITGSMSLNNMWMPEVKESATASAAMQEYLMSLLGPGASLTLKQVPKAIDYFNKGEILRGFEQLSPAFVRGAFTAERYEREGATTSSGAIIKDADEFTKGQLWAQRFGFATEGLVAQREAIFHLQGEILKVKRARTELLDRLERDLDKGSDADVQDVLTKMAKFNASNPFDAIKYENIKTSLKKQLERKMKSDRGMPIDKKYYPQVMEILEPSTRKLDREAEAARQ